MHNFLTFVQLQDRLVGKKVGKQNLRHKLYNLISFGSRFENLMKDLVKKYQSTDNYD